VEKRAGAIRFCAREMQCAPGLRSTADLALLPTACDISESAHLGLWIITAVISACLFVITLRMLVEYFTGSEATPSWRKGTTLVRIVITRSLLIFLSSVTSFALALIETAGPPVAIGADVAPTLLYVLSSSLMFAVASAGNYQVLVVNRHILYPTESQGSFYFKTRYVLVMLLLELGLGWVLICLLLVPPETDSNTLVEAYWIGLGVVFGMDSVGYAVNIHGLVQSMSAALALVADEQLRGEVERSIRLLKQRRWSSLLSALPTASLNIAMGAIPELRRQSTLYLSVTLSVALLMVIHVPLRDMRLPASAKKRKTNNKKNNNADLAHDADAKQGVVHSSLVLSVGRGGGGGGERVRSKFYFSTVRRRPRQHIT
jgi:hypothetical protein